MSNPEMAVNKKIGTGFGTLLGCLLVNDEAVVMEVPIDIQAQNLPRNIYSSQLMEEGTTVSDLIL